MTTEIIVYRSPGEQAVWQALSDGNAFPVGAGVIAFFFAFILLNNFWLERISYRRRTWPTRIALVLSGLFGIAVAKFLWL